MAVSAASAARLPSRWRNLAVVVHNGLAEVPVPGAVPPDVDTWADYEAVVTVARAEAS